MERRGDPVYEEVTTESIDIPLIVDNRKFSTTGDQAINIPENQIVVIVQVNEETAEYELNSTFEVMGNEWTIMDVDKTKVGIYIWTAERI